MKRRLIFTIVILSIVAIVGGGKAYADNKMKDYASLDQIKTISQTVGADLKVMNTARNGFKVLAHNGNEPIYITFDKSCSQEVIDTAKQTLDYMFGYTQKINDKYRYEVVENAKSSFFSDKTVIEYKAENLGEKDSQLSQASSIPNLMTIGKYNNRLTISYDKDTFDNDELSQSQEYNALLRELCHAFQFKEVSTGDSFVNPNVGNNMGLLSPNDVNCLASVYSPSNVNVQKYKLKINTIINECKDAYYKDVSKLITEERVDITEDKLHVILYEKMGDAHLFYNIVVKDGRYKLAIFDSNNLLIEKTEGNAELKGGVFILKSVKLKHGLSHDFEIVNNYNSDVMIFKDGEGKYELYDAPHNRFDTIEGWRNGEVLPEIAKMDLLLPGFSFEDFDMPLYDEYDR